MGFVSDLSRNESELSDEDELMGSRRWAQPGGTAEGNSLILLGKKKAESPGRPPILFKAVGGDHREHGSNRRDLTIKTGGQSPVTLRHEVSISADQGMNEKSEAIVVLKC